MIIPRLKLGLHDMHEGKVVPRAGNRPAAEAPLQRSLYPALEKSRGLAAAPPPIGASGTSHQGAPPRTRGIEAAP